MDIDFEPKLKLGIGLHKNSKKKTSNVLKKNLEKMCDLIEPLGIQWCTPNGIKVNYQKGEKQFRLFKRMKESGCYQITLAGESGVQRVLGWRGQGLTGQGRKGWAR